MTHAPCKRETELPPPPDGGWGWVVVFASFMIHIVTDGVTYSFGVFYVELVDYFDETKGATAWIASILVGVTLCSGPISSAFVNKYGCRAVTIVGSILASLCLIASSFAPNVFTLYFTAGIGTGFGFGLIYLPAIVSVTCYFEKYRSLATGIAVCGSGLGTFVFAPLTEYLVTTFGWRGAIAIIGVLVMFCVIFGILFRPIEVVEQIPMNGICKDLEECQPLKDISSENPLTPVNTVVSNGVADIQRRPHSVHAFTIPPRQGNVVIVNDKQGDMVRATLSQPMLVATVDGHGRTRHISESSSLKQTQGSGVMYKKDVLYSGSLANIPPENRGSKEFLLRAGNVYNFGTVSSLVTFPNKSTSCINENQKPEEKALMENPSFNGDKFPDDETTVCGCIPCHRETKDTLTEMLDLSLLKDPLFIIFAISNFCTSIGFSIPYVYIVAQSKKKGLDQEYSSYLLAIIGIANTISRIILGYLSDKSWVNRLCVYNWCLAICGISTALSAFCYDFTTFAIYASTYGFTIGAYVGLTSVILVDLLGLNKLTNAFGLLLLFQGLSSLIGPPMGGWLYDALNSYDPAFYLAGTMIAVSGIMLFILPSLQRCILHSERKRNEVYIDCS